MKQSLDGPVYICPKHNVEVNAFNPEGCHKCELAAQRAELGRLSSPQCEFCLDTGIEYGEPCGYCHTGELEQEARERDAKLLRKVGGAE